MTLKTYTTHNAVFFDISRLKDMFRQKFKRTPKCELVYSLQGDHKKPVHGLAVWYGEENQEELEFFVENLK